MFDIRRREFISLLGSAAAWPFAARAQQASKTPIVGFLGSGTSSSHAKWLASFVQRLSELGWIEGRTVVIEVRWAKGRNDRAAEIAADFVRRNVDVIVTTGAPTTLAAKQATGVIPIVFVGVGDPVAIKLVASFAAPGGNLTGTSAQQKDLVGKRIELLREVVPGLRLLATLFNASNPLAVMEMSDVQAAADKFGLAVVPLEIRRVEDIAPAFEQLKGHPDALYIQQDFLTSTNRNIINTWALGTRLPTVAGAREDAEAGDLMSYGASLPDLFRRGAEHVDKILRGTKPGEIPVEQPTKFELVINLKTAKALGLAIPQSVLALADEVIE